MVVVLVNSRRTLVVAVGVVKEMMRSALVLPVTAPPGSSTQAVPFQDLSVKSARGATLLEPVYKCALPTFILETNSISRVFTPTVVVCQDEPTWVRPSTALSGKAPGVKALATAGRW